MNLRGDLVESLLSQQSSEGNRPDRETAPSSHEKNIQTDAAAEPKEPAILLQFLLMVLLLVGLAVVGYRLNEADKAEERRKIIEAVTERLAVDRRVDTRPIGSEKKASSEDDDDVSFENLEFSASGTSR